MGNLTTGVRRSVDLRGFLKQTKANENGIKYTSESGKTHRFFIPYVVRAFQQEDGTVINEPTTVSEMHSVHEWIGKDGKFKSALCLSELGQDCPFCNRVGDAWEVYRYRYDVKLQSFIAQGLSEEQAKYEMDGDKDKKVGGKQGAYKKFLDEMKMKKSKDYFYLLVAQFELDASGNPVIEAGIPKYDLKVMKLSESRVEKLASIADSAGGHLEGLEIKIDYKATEDVAERVGQSSISGIYPDYMFTRQYAGLADKINGEAAEFSWEGIEKSFGELTVYTPEGATQLCEENFRSWDNYKKEKEVNPGARYLEYNDAQNDKPAIAGGSTVGAPIPNFGGAPAPTLPTTPVVGVAPTAGVAPAVGTPAAAPTVGAPVGGAIPTTPVASAPMVGAPVVGAAPAVGTPAAAPTVGAPAAPAASAPLGVGAPIPLQP